MNGPAVAVVIPTRNRLEYLQPAIRSVLHQSVRELECLVVDDCSDDGTRQWLESVDDPRVRPIFLDHSRERSAARNAGLAATRAPLVLFLDDDDLLARHGLETGLRTARRFPEAAMIVGRQVAFDERGYRRAERHPESRWPVDFWRATMLGLTYVPGQILLRTADVRSIGGWNEELRVVEDQDFLIRLGPGRRAAYTRRVMLYKRKHAAQHVGTPADKAAEDRLRRAHVASMRDSRFARRAHDLYRARVAYMSALDVYTSGCARAALVPLCEMVIACPALLVDRLVAPSLVRFSMKAVIRSLPEAERVWSALRPLVRESEFHSAR